MPALPTYLIEPIWEQFVDLLPTRKTHHPLGCHRTRIPDRVIFEKLAQVLVFGCAYRRIADDSCSASTLRRRRDEWIDSGAMETLRRLALEAYDRIVGLESSDVAVDGCITKAPCGGEKAGRSPVDRGKWGTKRSTVVDARAIPLGAVAAPANRHNSPLLGETLDALEALGPLPERVSVHLDRGYDSEATCQKMKARGPVRRDLREGQAGPATGRQTLGGEAHELLAQRPQEAFVAHRAPRRVVDFWIAFYDVIIIVRRLIRQARTH